MRENSLTNKREKQKKTKLITVCLGGSNRILKARKFK